MIGNDMTTTSETSTDEYEVSLRAVFEATSEEDAVEQFREWLNSGHRTVLIRNFDTGHTGHRDLCASNLPRGTNHD